MATDTKFLQSFKAARRVSTPLIAVQTPDPASTISLIAAQCTNGDSDAPLVIWDTVRGFWTFPRHNSGLQAIATICGQIEPDQIVNPTDALRLSVKMPEKGILFIMNSHLSFKADGFSQAVWNLRDLYKQNKRTLILLAPAFSLPAEITQDVVILSEPLPTAAELSEIVKTQFANAALPEPSQEIVSKAIDAISGLAAFPAEQVTAMSLTKSGLDLVSLWDRKRTQVEQTPGLQIWTGGERLDDVKDCGNLIGFLRRYLKNVSGILFIDEIEKAMAGARGDTSGVSQEMHGTLLSYMQDRQAKGILLLGFPGTGKSMSAKAAGSLEGKPVIKFDLSQMKDSLVGSSNQRLTNALKVVDAVAQGKVLVIATCNDLSALSPELKSRFRQGTFFFDLPSASGREDLWTLYTSKFNLKESKPGFDSSGWTGREISTCCELSADLGVSLKEASSYIVPFVQANPAVRDALRKEATGRYISAQRPGVYNLADADEVSSRPRKIETE